MKDILLGATLVGIGVIVGILSSTTQYGLAHAQSGISQQSGDALWHLPKFGEQGWFIHASSGRVRACNMDKASVVAEKQGPRCSNWE